MGTPSVAVVLVNWNGREDLRRCLTALSAQTDRDFECVVVDNGSEDGSAELVRREFRTATLLETGANLGFAEASNRGIRATSTDWVALLNVDAEAAPDWLATLRASAAEAAPSVGMLQSQIVFRDRPAILNSTGVRVARDGGFVDRDFGEPVRPGDAVEEIFCPCAGAALYRRTMLDALELSTGFFDRSFFMYFEDVDLGWRARLAGWSTLYVPGARVAHAFNGSSGRQYPHFVRLHCERNRVRTLLKNASWAQVGRALPRFVSGFAWSTTVEGLGAVGAWTRAVRDGLGQRGAVASRACVPRRVIEQQWVRAKK